MLTPQSTIYLLVPNSANERVLHPGRVLEAGGEEFVIQFEKQVAPPPGSDVNIFFEQGARFMQQAASIVAFRDPPPVAPDQPFAAAPQIVVMRPSGNPISAESRGSYRVSVITLQIPAIIDADRKCELVDISPEGFGALTTNACKLGTVAKVKVEYEGESLEGHVRVQTMRKMPSGKLRCGFMVPSTETAMRRSLQKLTALVQRMQLRRLKRSA